METGSPGSRRPERPHWGSGVQDFNERFAFSAWTVAYSEEDVERTSLGQARQIRTADRSPMTASGTVDDTQRGALIE